MKSGRRLLLMAAGLLTVCSCSLAWIDQIMPANIKLGTLITSTVTTLFGNAVIINVDLLDHINLLMTLFVIGVIIMAAAATGSKAVAAIGLILAMLAIVMNLIASGLGLFNIFTNFANLGLGMQLAMLACLLILFVLLLPKIKKLFNRAKPTA
ncbi:MAG: hypothetical protein Q4C83_01370 [Candidatus Saccharibacteria bacterium]|nr:hypothetical protein [Candidatus Saccharibacteria bacterium]